MTDVSVLTPSYGYGRFIRDNILSIRQQTGVSIQHVVQDAGSTDDTLDILREYGDAIDWVSEPDDGQSDALNRALRRADGRWVAWLNADEFYLPGALKRLVDHAEATGADVVYADDVIVDRDGNLMRLLPPHRFSDVVLRLYGCFLASSSLIIRRSVLPDQPWDAALRMMMDWELYLNLVSRGAKFVDLRYPVGAFRQHDERVTAAPQSEFAHEYARVFERYDISPKQRRWGKWLHRGAKMISGSYIRERRTQRLQGSNLRWFANQEALQNAERLLATTYPE